MRACLRWSLPLLGLAAAAACVDSLYYVVDQYPVSVDLDAGVPILHARAAALDDQDRQVLIDTCSPLTVLDVGSPDVGRRRLTIELLHDGPPGGPPILRARFTDVITLTAPVGAVGLGTPREIQGVIGGNVLTQLAVRFDAQRREIRFFPDFPGSDTTHEDACEAVFHFALGGGGTFVTGTEEDTFPATRVVLEACLSPTSGAECRGQDAGICHDSGQDALLVLATGVSSTVLSRTAFKKATGKDDAYVDALPTTNLYLPGYTTPFVVPRATLPSLALINHESHDNTPVRPCHELTISRTMAHGACASAADCPCPTPTDLTCNAGAAVELVQDLDVVIVEDTHPLLQSIRNELRPNTADIDGLLGMNALTALVADLDYTKPELIVRCSPPGPTCRTRPRIVDGTRQEQLADGGCL